MCQLFVNILFKAAVRVKKRFENQVRYELPENLRQKLAIIEKEEEI